MRLINPYRHSVLSTATAWWSPSVTTGGNTLVGRISGHNMVFGGGGAAPTITTAGGYNIVDFDGGDWMEAADHADLKPGAGAFAFLIVVAFDATDSMLASKGANATGQSWWNLYGTTGGDLTARIRLASTTNTDATRAAVLAAGSTIYGAGIRRSSSMMYAHLDGTASAGVANSVDIANSGTLRIGNNSNGAGTFLDGKFYGAAFWKGTAPTDAQLLTAKIELLAAAAL